MARYIDADKLKEDVISKSSNRLDAEWHTMGILNTINSQKTADVVPVDHGEWIEQDDYPPVCSECGCYVGKEVYPSDCATPQFCPHCGTKMDRKEDAE